MTSKAEYHYKKAKAILRKLEDEAHMSTKQSEHERLMQVADKHMEFYKYFRDEETRQYQGPYPGTPRTWQTNPSPYTVTYGGVSTSNAMVGNTLGNKEEEKRGPDGDVVS